MNMLLSTLLVVVVTVLYAITSVAYFFQGNVHFSIVFAGYAIANIGLIMAGGGH